MEDGEAIAEWGIWGIGSLWGRKKKVLDLIGVRDIPHSSMEN